MATSAPLRRRSTHDLECYDQRYNESAKIDAANLLPDVLETIFSYLDLPNKGRASQVCQAWRYVMNQPSLFRQVQAHLNSEDSVAQLPVLVKRGIRRITFRCRHYSFQPCKNKNIGNTRLVIVGGLPRLSSLEISWCLMMEPTMPVALLEKMPQLAHLRLSAPFSSFRSVTNVCVERISQMLVNLVTLRLDSCNVTDTELKSIVSHLGALKDLEIKRCYITDQGIEYLSGLDKLLVHKPKLETLNLSNCVHLTDRSLFYLSQGQENLRNLNLRGNRQLTDAGLAHLVHLHLLETLDLMHCELLSDRGMSHIAKMVHLRTLHTHPISDEGLVFLDESGSKIETINLFRSRNFAITAHGVFCLSRLTNLRDLRLPLDIYIGEYGMLCLGRMASLQKLRIGYNGTNDNCLAKLVDGGSKITSLDISNCIHLTDHGLDHLSRMASLEELGINIRGGITDVGLTNLANGRAKITKLNVSMCDFKTPAGQRSLALIANGLFSLRVLRISRNVIDNDWLKMAAKNLPHLHTLDDRVVNYMPSLYWE